MTQQSGSFETPGWPHDYPQDDFQCEWIIDISVVGFAIRFTIDESAYGISGRPPCTRDNIEFFDGLDSGAESLHKLCQFENPGPFTTTSSRARIVFTGTVNPHRPRSRVGIRVKYTLVDLGELVYIRVKETVVPQCEPVNATLNFHATQLRYMV